MIASTWWRRLVSRSFFDGDSTKLRARKRSLAYAQSATSGGNLAGDSRRALEREGALRLMSQVMSRCLVIIDVQLVMFAFRRPLYQGEEVLERIAGLLERARDARVPIFHVQHDGGSGHILAKGSMGWPHHPLVHPRSG